MHLHDLLFDGSYLAVNGILPLEAILLPSDICDGSILRHYVNSSFSSYRGALKKKR